MPYRAGNPSLLARHRGVGWIGQVTLACSGQRGGGREPNPREFVLAVLEHELGVCPGETSMSRLPPLGRKCRVTGLPARGRPPPGAAPPSDVGGVGQGETP